MNTKNPSPGELWEMEVWSSQGNYIQHVLILNHKKDLDPEQYGAEVSLFDCLVHGQRQTLPIWMFNNAQLISFKRV